MSGIRVNVDCAERAVTRLQEQLREFASSSDAPVIVIGQSRGGMLARCLAVREPELVAGLVTLGSPVLDQLAVSAPVLRMVRSVAMLAIDRRARARSRAAAQKASAASGSGAI